MKHIISISFVVILSALLTPYVKAQNKDLSYYVDHPTEVLPAARESFNAGHYKLTQDLCRFEPLLPDYQKSECAKLNEDAKKCDSIRAEISILRLSGQIKDAKEKAQELLRINPKDPVAKEVIMIKEPEPEPESSSEQVLVTEYVPFEEESVSDTNPEQESGQELEQVSEQVQTQELASEIELATKQESDTESAMSGREQQDTPDVVVQEPIMPTSEQSGKKYHTRFSLAAGAYLWNLYDSRYFCPEITVGLLDIGGSRLGVHIGAFYPFYIQMIGVDALLDVRLIKNLYFSFGPGFFINDMSSAYGPLFGMSFEGGLSYMLFNHLSLGAKIRYLPEVHATVTKYADIANPYYYLQTVANRGIYPSLSIGWVF